MTRRIGLRLPSVRLRLPTSVVVTLLGAGMTVWLAPALTRQWEDRQVARDLKAGVAKEMVSSAAFTIGEGVPLADGQGRFDAIHGRWREAGLVVEVQQKAYFSPPVVRRWRSVVQDVGYFLTACDDVAAAHTESRRRGDGAAAFEYRRVRILDALKLIAPTVTQADAAARLLASDDPATRGLGMGELKSWTWAKVESATDAVLSAHPEGFSTTRGDLLRDLLP